MVSWQTWIDAIHRGVKSVPDEILVKAATVLLGADLVVSAGNGGSSAIASHAAQAVSKPSYGPGGGRPAVCLSDNQPTFTAHANDGGWVSALEEAARPFFDSVSKCALLVLSSSGRSENVCRLARLASDRGIPIIALTGFSGEPLRSLATVSLHVDSHDYEVVEPVHDALVHRVQYHIRSLAEKCVS